MIKEVILEHQKRRKTKVRKNTDDYNKLSYFFWVFWIRFSVEAKIITLSDMDLKVCRGNI